MILLDLYAGDPQGPPSRRLVESLSSLKLNTECDQEVVCSVYSVSSPINYRSHSFCVMVERGYDDEELINLTDICEQLPRRLNGRDNCHSHLPTVVPGEEGKKVRVVLKL